MKTNLFGASEFDVKTNCRIKYYYDSSGNLYPTQLLYCRDRKIFLPPEFELDTTPKQHTKREDNETQTSPCTANSESAIIRAKKNLYDIIRCNPFTHFVTLTFDSAVVDREDYTAVVRRFSQWCDNRVRRKDFIYAGVIERHKQSNGLHFHVLCNDVLTFVDSGTVKCVGRKKPIKIATADKYKIPESDRKTVYNIPEWSYGFSTALEITNDDKCAKVANYLKKYLTKDFEKIGGRYYYSGGNLRRPVYKYVDYEINEDEADFVISVGGVCYYGQCLEGK